MTDKDIIKALETLASENIGDCKRDCAFYDGKVHYCGGIVAKHSLDLIKRQQEEIDELKRQIENLELEAELEWERKVMMEETQ